MNLLKMYPTEQVEDVRRPISLIRQPMVKNKPKLSPKHRRSRSLDGSVMTRSDNHRAAERRKVVEKWKKVVLASRREASPGGGDEDGYEAESSEDEYLDEDVNNNKASITRYLQNIEQIIVNQSGVQIGQMWTSVRKYLMN